MASAFQAFNSLLEMFLKELKKGFPQHKETVEKAEDILAMTVKANFKTPVTVFLQYGPPFVQKVMARDESALLEFDEKKLIGLKIKPLWDEADDQSKDVIWQYMSSIAFMGMGLGQLDEAGLNLVDNLVKTIENTGGNFL